MTPEITLVAMGGNALWPKGGSGAPADQIAAARSACAPLVSRVAAGERLLIVFGNGPQVGAELERNEMAASALAPAALDTCVASTQGTMGYFLDVAVRAELAAAGIDAPVTALLTLVVVDPDDPGFGAPSKPIGPRGLGVRQRVPSPRPLEILDAAAIRLLLDAGHVVLAGGGGGIPVARQPDRSLRGVEAVIDKDRTAAMLAAAVGARTFVNLTAVDSVYQGFGGPDATPLSRLTRDEAARLVASGAIPDGSMGPKVEAALTFLDAGGERVVITSLARVADAFAGRCGTWITRGTP